MYLLKRLRGRQINSIKIFAGEILSVILQNSDDNRKKVGEADGVDILLKQLANFKKKDPKEYFLKAFSNRSDFKKRVGLHGGLRRPYYLDDKLSGP